MSEHDFDGVDQCFHLTDGVAERVANSVSSIVAIHKDFFFQFPSGWDLEHNAAGFAEFTNIGLYEFPSVYGALGTIDINVIPALPDSHAVPCADDPTVTTTAVKLQCTCGPNGFLQSCFVLVPVDEIETKNVEALKQSPLFDVMTNRPIDGYHMIADLSFDKIPFLLTALDTNEEGAKEYNGALESARAIIDQTFSIIRNRFPVLDRLKTDDAGSVCNMIESVCVLYNVFVANDGANYHIE